MRALKTIPVLLLMALLGCGISEISISIAPREATVNANGQVQFSASVDNAGNKDVAWSATGGTVSPAGLFTAPALPGICYVTATSQADPAKTATATVSVVAPVVITPNQVNIIPGAIQTFTAVVAATGDTNVTWSIQEGAAGGSITAAGEYTAPLVSGTYHVVATSVADPTLSGLAIVTVAPSI
ncbi:MAG: hypothetical protein Q8K67_09690 [Geothrix sp.]|nr:hypothetical protein [Geothrix sp.]